MAATTVMSMTMTSYEGHTEGMTKTLTRRRESRTIRYCQGWRNTEQDRKPTDRVARIINQHYSNIKQECLAQKTLWEDPAFPATDQSIYPSSSGPLPFKWMRPSVSAFNSLTPTVAIWVRLHPVPVSHITYTVLAGT